MGHRRSKNRKRNLKSRTSRSISWSKESDATRNKSESALERFLFSLFCFQWFCNKSKPNQEVDGDNDFMSPHSSYQTPSIHCGGDRIPTRRGGQRPSHIFNRPETFEDSLLPSDNIMGSHRTEALEGNETDWHEISAKDLELIFTPLPGAVIDDDYLYPASDLFILPGFPVRHSSMIRHGQLPPLHYDERAPSPPSYTALNAATNGNPINSISSRPTTALSTRWMDGSMNEQLDLDQGIIIPSRKVAWIEAIDSESDKKEKKKKNSMKKYQVAQKWGKKKQSPKTELKGTSIVKIPTVKEWAKQEEKKRKAEKKQQKKELKEDKKKQKEMEKRVAKANKLKEAQKRRKDKESKEAEKEVSKAKKAAAKAVKAAAKAKEVAAKAEAKKMKKKDKLEQQLQQVLDESDKQMAAGQEKVEQDAMERKRKRENKAKNMLMKITRTEETIKSLQEKVDRKEKKVVQLKNKSGSDSILVTFTLQYKIKEYQQRIRGIKNMIGKLKKKVDARKKEIERLAPHPLKSSAGDFTKALQQKDARPCSPNSDGTNSMALDDDDESILDMLCGLDSDSECSDDEIEEVTVPKENIQPNFREILQKAQESLVKMDEAGQRRGSDYSVSEEEPSYSGKGKGPANGKKVIEKFLSQVH